MGLPVKVIPPTPVEQPPVEQPPVEQPPVSPAVMPAVTAEQRAKVRNLLDAHFDGEVGCYDNAKHTDEWVASQSGVPKGVVERMRETAYGPIKVDPVMSGFREALASFKAQFDALHTQVDKAEAEVAALKKQLGIAHAAVMGLSSRVERRLAGAG